MMKRRKQKRIVTNCDKLKGLLVEKRKNYNECALALGLSEYQFRMTINGKADFWVSETIELAHFLKLTNEEFISVFIPFLVKTV